MIDTPRSNACSPCIIGQCVGLFKVVALVLLLVSVSVGCESSPSYSPGQNVVFLVPGVGGDGAGYQAMRRGLSEGGMPRPVIAVEWGAPKLLFMANFTNPTIHEDAEDKLARKMMEARQINPAVRIDLIGHSAGAGVVCGALKRLPPGVRVRTVLLLSPSFSPQYDLVPAMSHVDGVLHLFFSDRDTVFLEWRTSTFGTYDGIKTKAAGNVGMPYGSSEKFRQYAYDPSWRELGNDGGHYGVIAEAFARRVLAPMLN